MKVESGSTGCVVTVSRLESWAREHTARYRYLDGEADYIDQRERYKFCPPGSPHHYPVPGQEAMASKVENIGHKTESVAVTTMLVTFRLSLQ